MNWTKEWPTEEGHYWLYYPEKDKLEYVKVRQAGSKPNKFLIYVENGHFLFKEENKNKVMWWIKATLPTLPEGL